MSITFWLYDTLITLQLEENSLNLVLSSFATFSPLFVGIDIKPEVSGTSKQQDCRKRSPKLRKC